MEINNNIHDVTLPKGWTYCNIEEVVISRKGKRPLKLSNEKFENAVPYLDIKGIEVGKFDNYADTDSSILISENELIVVWDGSRSGWVGKGKYGALGSTLVALLPVLVDINYLYYFLKSKFEYINSNIKGSGIPHVNQDIFWNLRLPLAPLEEQKRIALKLDEAFSKLNATQTSLEKIPDIVNASKQKILNRAFAGELTKEWRITDHNSTLVDELKSFEKDDVTGWYNVKSYQCCSVISNGSTPKGKRFEISTGIPFLKVYNIVDQKINFNYKPQFIDKITHQRLKKSMAFPNDVLINIVGPPLGKVAIIPNEYPEWNMNQALVLFRVKEYLLPEYLYYFFVEGTQIKLIEHQYRGSAGQSNISLTQCRNFTIKVPTKNEQIEIVDRISSQFAELDTILEKNINVKKSITASIDKILEEAFMGELTSQNSNEEDAATLLSNIKNEKPRISDELSKVRKLKSQEKSILMATKKNITFLDLLKKEFGKKDFTFKDIEEKIDLEYDVLKDEVYSLLNGELQMEFNDKSNTMFFKFKAS